MSRKSNRKKKKIKFGNRIEDDLSDNCDTYRFRQLTRETPRMHDHHTSSYRSRLNAVSRKDKFTTITTTQTTIQKHESLELACLSLAPFWDEVSQIPFGSMSNSQNNKLRMMCFIVQCMTYAGKFTCSVSDSEWKNQRKSIWYISSLNFSNDSEKKCSINYKTIIFMLQLHFNNMLMWDKQVIKPFFKAINKSVIGDGSVFHSGDFNYSPYSSNVDGMLETCNVEQLWAVVNEYLKNNVAIQRTYEEVLTTFKTTLKEMTWVVRDVINTRSDGMTVPYKLYRNKQRGQKHEQESDAFRAVYAEMLQLGVVCRVQNGSWKFNGQYPDKEAHIVQC